MANRDLPDIYSTKPAEVQERKITPVVTQDDYFIRKRPLGKKLGDVLINGDIKYIKGFLINDVLIPSIKETIFELANRGLEMLLFNDSRVSESSNKKNQTYISYNNYSNKEKSRSHYNQKPQTYEIRDLDDVIFRDRGKADLVFESIMAIYDEFHVVRKADALQIISDEEKEFQYIGEFTDNNWGWEDMTGACVKRVRGGWILDFPKMTHL